MNLPSLHWLISFPVRWIQTSHHHLINNKTAKLHVDIFSFISVSASCSFWKYLGTVQERYHKEKRVFFYIQAPTVLRPGTWTNRRLIILYRYNSLLLRRFVFRKVEASDWWWTARDHGKCTDGRGEARFLLPAFLCAHMFIEREVSGYEAADICCMC